MFINISMVYNNKFLLQLKLIKVLIIITSKYIWSSQTTYMLDTMSCISHGMSSQSRFFPINRWMKYGICSFTHNLVSFLHFQIKLTNN